MTQAKIEARQQQMASVEEAIQRLRGEEAGLHEQLLQLNKEQDAVAARCNEIKAKTVAGLREKARMHEEEEENIKTMEASDRELETLRRGLEEQRKRREQLDDTLLQHRHKMETAMHDNEGKRQELRRLEQELQMENVVLEEHKAVRAAFMPACMRVAFAIGTCI